MKTDLGNHKAESQVKLEAETTRLQAEIDNLQMVEWLWKIIQTRFTNGSENWLCDRSAFDKTDFTHGFNSIGLQKFDDKEKKIEALEAARLANVPVDTKEEINNLNLKIVSAFQMRNFSLIVLLSLVFVSSMHISFDQVAITKEKDVLFKDKTALESQMKELQAKLNSKEKSAENQKAASSDVERKLKVGGVEI